MPLRMGPYKKNTTPTKTYLPLQNPTTPTIH